MSYNGSGTFVINTAGQPVVSGTVISSTAFNALTADLATGLSTAITKDGQTTPTANIPMGNNKITNLAVGTAATDAANLSQVQSTTAKLVNSISGADTITGTMSPNLAAYATGQMFYFIAAGDNTGAVTLNIDSLGAKAVTRDGTTALAAGDIQSGEVCVVVYDGTRFQLVNGASQSASIVTENLTVNKATVLNESGGDNDTRIEGDTDANLVFVDASADKVGIGKNNPVYKLDVSGAIQSSNGGNENYFLNDGTNRSSIQVSGAALYFNVNDNLSGQGTAIWRSSSALTERMRLDASGNFLVGTTTADNKVTISSSSSGAAAGVLSLVNPNDATSSAADLDFVTHSSGTLATGRIRSFVGGADNYPMSFWTYGSGGLAERARITAGGRLTVKTSTYDNGIVTADNSWDPASASWATLGASFAGVGSYGGGMLFIDSNTAGYALWTQDSGKDFYIKGNTVGVAMTGGVYLNDYATSWSSASDENVKDIIEPIENAIEKVVTLRTVIGKYKDEAEGKRHPFLIAQDVEKVLPEAVSKMNKGQDNECLGLSYTDTIPLLVAAIKEQQAMIEELKAKVAALEAK